jgi:diaminopimelate decarboxylase
MKEKLTRLINANSFVTTPFYIYDAQAVSDRISALDKAFGSAFAVSFAIKSNPNQQLLNHIAPQVGFLDASSFYEVQRALRSGAKPEQISYSGPGKRHSELQAFIGLGAELIVESFDEIEMAAEIARQKGTEQKTLLRINPSYVPRGFGASMSGSASQFGIDQEQMPAAIRAIMKAPGLHLDGFHIYTGSNCLNAQAIVENFQNISEIFVEASACAGIRPQKLVYGAGFGLPYHTKETDLDIDAVQQGIMGNLKTLLARPEMAQAQPVLELGRWIVGPCGMLVTRVLSRKTSRGTEIAVCDAGFNNHLAACGLMGAVFQKNWPLFNLSRPEGEIGSYRISGPLCTSIDTIARKIDLPEVRRGDFLAIGMSGAYGLTASPTRFISHPEPLEYICDGDKITEVTESCLNHAPSGSRPDADITHSKG